MTYDDLIKSLRVCGRALEIAAFPEWDVSLYTRAADAIEELNKRCEEAYSNGLLEGGIAQRAEDEKWMPRWIPVTERLPEGDEDVLLCYEWTGRSGTIYREVGINSISEIVNNPTEMLRPLYWMPLSEPPKDGEE